MKKRILLTVLALVCVFLLAACGCEHEWAAANCVDPQTCSLCGETEGEALGHSWVDPDCVTPKTCSVCGVAEGEALGHSWVDADCVNPQTCSVCGETEGEALGHTWMDATTEAPQTCSVCSETFGERIITDERFTTAEVLPFMGSWEGDLTFTGEHLGMPDLEGEIPMHVIYTFGNAGDYTIDITLTDWEGFLALLKPYMLEVMYAEFEGMGYDRETTDVLIEEYYGMTMDELVDASLAEMSPEDVETSAEMVYYVENGTLYIAESWEDEMVELPYVLEDAKLTLELEDYGPVDLTPVYGE